MKKKWMSAVCVGTLLAGLLTGCSVMGVELLEEEDVKNLTEELDTFIEIDYEISSYEAVQNFSREFFEANMEKENPVLSPVSAYLALGMAGTGARGETLAEFQNLLGDDLSCIPHSLMTTLPREEEGMKISLANSAWVDDAFEVEADYLVAIDSYYQSQVYSAKLSTEQTMEDMNAWIEANTSGLIDKLLEEPLDEDVRLVLFNTIYFKGKWKNTFSESATCEREFTTQEGTVEMVDMMHKYEEYLLYVSTDGVEGVVLPYEDENMAFVALMPTDGSTVREMYEKLTWEDISAMTKTKEKTLCNLQLPKFEVEFSQVLNDSLKEMGLQRAFDAKMADLSGMGSSKDGDNICIGLVQQKAVVIVDEEGTEAAAVTEILVMTESCPVYEEPPVDIFFNRPFLYMIVDLEKDIPLFMGIMDNPNL